MAAESVRPLLSVKGVTIDLTSSQPSMGDGCTVELHDTQLDLISGTVRISLPFSVIKTINLHQPIFGANYIEGEYINQGERCSFTLTFKKGGATDFTRLLFRLAEGELLQDPPPSTAAPTASQEVSTSQEKNTDDKKNR